MINEMIESGYPKGMTFEYGIGHLKACLWLVQLLLSWVHEYEHRRYVNTQ